jgi:integrase
MAPATHDILAQLLDACPATLIGKRDRALLALGFAGAFRRSELCALEVADLVEVPYGLRVVIRRSKTDQTGEGQEVAIPRGYKLRPVEAVQTWLATAEISSGPVFRAVALGGRVSDTALADDSASRIVKRYASRVGLEVAAFSGHSLRSGFLTSAAESAPTSSRWRRCHGIARWTRCAAMSGAWICSRSTRGRRSCEVADRRSQMLGRRQGQGPMGVTVDRYGRATADLDGLSGFLAERTL